MSNLALIGTLAKRSKRKAKRKVKMAHCDKVHRKLILVMFGHRCAICGKTEGQIDIHHIISRASHFFRHNPNNGIPLCPVHHTFSTQLSAHGTPWAFEEWMQENRPYQYEWWVQNRNTVLPSLKIDYGKVLDVLKSELAKLEDREK